MDAVGLFLTVCLASFLEEKGILNRQEFADYLEKMAPYSPNPEQFHAALQILKETSHLRAVPSPER